eukprot:CAMPEP_0178938096 /NCGR_PEP_ID=MMETSP0786-20121207/26142_1 /TAXON_ID=186022 /ORGANISM="Thalassionema frauenfeldii, Strain CCMP 1798" /LENGTH=640 /DNA_ID=CAMNT_0020616779 /DNA_START=129 /DNA_END=2051 /DNA_ORIENTATION=+
MFWLSLSLLLLACARSVTAQANEYMTIYDLLLNDGRFSETFLYFADVLGFKDPLENYPGQLTVFAFTDQAWYTSFPSTCSLDILGPDRVAYIFLHHIYEGGAVIADNLPDGAQAQTLSQDGVVTITVAENGNKYIDDAMLINQDGIAATADGVFSVVHVINRVLIPPGIDLPPECRVAPNVVAEAENNGLSTFASIVNDAGLAAPLANPGPFTIFVPTNEAFASFEYASCLVENGIVADLLLYHMHVLSLYPVMAWQMGDGQEPPMANGDISLITIANDKGYINDAEIIGANLLARNGVLHVIDKVLIPPSMDLVSICAGSSPTISPTKEPTESPTATPTKEPTESPTKTPTVEPTESPTTSPTKEPTEGPTKSPTMEPTESPTATPTKEPTESPTKEPTDGPTKTPTVSPTMTPTKEPTDGPTKTPTVSPTMTPTKEPTDGPTDLPTSSAPVPDPTVEPTMEPTKEPTDGPTKTPTMEPTVAPTGEPTDGPTLPPVPVIDPTPSPTGDPTNVPTGTPTKDPTSPPTRQPTSGGTGMGPSRPVGKVSLPPSFKGGGGSYVGYQRPNMNGGGISFSYPGSSGSGSGAGGTLASLMGSSGGGGTLASMTSGGYRTMGGGAYRPSMSSQDGGSYKLPRYSGNW